MRTRSFLSCLLARPALVAALVLAVGAACSDDSSPADARVDGSSRDASLDASKDSKLPDMKQPDMRKADMKQADGSQPDAKQSDTMQADAATTDATAADGGTPPDAAQVDVAQADMAQADVAQADSVVVTPDGPAPDAALVPDTATADVAALDTTVVPDAQVPDTAPVTFTLSGTLNQLGGPNLGTQVYVRLYTSNLPSEILNHVAEWSINVISGQNIANLPFVFNNLANGTYYLRAFRDDGGRNNAPDGQPTLLSDAQSASRMVVVNGNTSLSGTLDLTARGNTNDAFDNFDARTINSTDETAPIGDDLGVRVAGPGRCGGFYLSLSADRLGTQPTLSTPSVRLPSGTVVSMLNDGACGPNIHNNANSSYDASEADDTYTYGIASPQPTAAGDYTFFYHQTTDDFIHIEVDHIATIIRMPRARDIASPTGATRNTNLSPQISWQPITGATQYEVLLASRDDLYNNGDDVDRFVSQAVYTPTDPLLDDRCYQLTVRATDANQLGDIDAESQSPGDRFCTDVDGAQSITVTGTLTNNTGNSTDHIQVYAESNDQNAASVRLSANATTYTLSLLAGAPDAGMVQAFVDTAGTQVLATPENRRLSVSYTGLNMGTRPTPLVVDLILSPGPQLTSPAQWALLASVRPTLSWQDYRQVTGRPTGQWSYLLTLGDGGNPEVARIVLPMATNSFDLSSLPPLTDWFDLNALASCEADGGTIAVAASGQPICTGGASIPSQTVLSAGRLYDWSVSIIECDFTQFTPPSADTFLDCLRGVAGGGVYATSELRGMISP